MDGGRKGAVMDGGGDGRLGVIGGMWGGWRWVAWGDWGVGMGPCGHTLISDLGSGEYLETLHDRGRGF